MPTIELDYLEAKIIRDALLHAQDRVAGWLPVYDRIKALMETPASADALPGEADA